MIASDSEKNKLKVQALELEIHELQFRNQEHIQ